MERYLSGPEVEKVLEAASFSEERYIELMERDLERGRLWETDDYPEPAVVIGDGAELGPCTSSRTVADC